MVEVQISLEQKLPLLVAEERREKVVLEPQQQEVEEEHALAVAVPTQTISVVEAELLL